MRVSPRRDNLLRRFVACRSADRWRPTRKRSAISAVHKSHIYDLNSVKLVKMPSKTGVFCSCSQVRTLAERRMNNRARRARNIFGRTKARRVVALPGCARMRLFSHAPVGRPRMTIHVKLLCAAAAAGFAAVIATSPAQALTAPECSAKYQAAKKGGTLAGQKWNDFRKAQCGADATPAAAPTAAAPAPAAPKEAKKEATAPAAPAGPAVFPNAVDQKYSKESEGKARMHTCVDQYNANKTANANGGLKWIQKGGGYYSECTKKLKGAA